MASYSVAGDELGVRDKALVAATADTVTFHKDCDRVEVMNVSGAAAIYFSVDGSVPTVSGAKTYHLPSTASSLTVNVAGGGETVVKLISAGTPTYDVSDATGQ